MLPAALQALGGDLPEEVVRPEWALEPTRRVVVVLADGLGQRQLARRSGHARTLRRMTPVLGEDTFRCGFPSTTATSLTSLGTGRSPGDHGIVGWLTRYRGRVFNHLAWQDGPDPGGHQPLRTMLQEAARRDVAVTTVSRTLFEDSGFTKAALRGGSFVPSESPTERLEGVLSALTAAGRRGRALVYAYWSEVDRTGHIHGPDSWEWGEAVEAFDGFVAGLLERSPAGTTVLVTSDHGMIEAPMVRRRDLALEPALADGVELCVGEPRVPQLWCRPGAVDDVVDRWRAELGEDALVMTREELFDRGWLGPVRDGYAERVGQVVVAMLSDATALDSRLVRPEVLRLRGQHGSITDEETAIPLLVAQT